LIPLSDPDAISHSRPYVNIMIIGINTLMFLYEISMGSLESTVLFFRLGLIPAEILGGEEVGLRTFIFNDTYRTIDLSSPFGPWVTILSSMFLHAGFMHFISNMIYLWVFGDNIEDRLGHAGYILFYILCGAIAAWTHVLFNTNSQTPLIGASGAIAGVLGAYLLLYPYSKINTLAIFIFITVIKIRAIYLLSFWFILQFFKGLGAIGFENAGVAYWAHVGGFISGALIIMIYLKLRGEHIRPWHRPSVIY